jgi:hypothetical protein
MSSAAAYPAYPARMDQPFRLDMGELDPGGPEPGGA